MSRIPSPLAAMLCAACLVTLAGPVSAGPVERACIGSERAQATPSLCRCIGGVADRALTRRDQRLAASFFSDPHLAQEIRQSDSRSDEAFWQRYKEFGETASRTCQ